MIEKRENVVSPSHSVDPGSLIGGSEVSPIITPKMLLSKHRPSSGQFLSLATINIIQINVTHVSNDRLFTGWNLKTNSHEKLHNPSSTTFLFYKP